MSFSSFVIWRHWGLGLAIACSFSMVSSKTWEYASAMETS